MFNAKSHIIVYQNININKTSHVMILKQKSHPNTEVAALYEN